MEILVYATLRDVVGGKCVNLDGGPQMTVGQMLQQLFAKYPALQAKVVNSKGDLHTAFHIFINGRDARYINGMDTIVNAGDEVRIFPPVGGGQG